MGAAAITFVKLRSGAKMYPNLNQNWKVTARYLVDAGAQEPLRCVRVRCGVGPVFHFTEERFEQLFERDEARE